ncbi:hypothetical protein AAC387_Pa04g1270 [Persea americana]
MPAERKTDMWQGSKFEFPTDKQQRVKKWVFSKIYQNWKNWKSKLKKKHYDLFHTTRERLQYRPNRVDPIQWALLIEFWGTEDGTERSKRNVENRTMQTMNHTVGTKSFTRIREEERERNLDGQVPDGWRCLDRPIHAGMDSPWIGHRRMPWYV